MRNFEGCQQIYGIRYKRTGAKGGWVLLWGPDVQRCREAAGINRGAMAIDCGWDYTEQWYIERGRPKKIRAWRFAVMRKVIKKTVLIKKNRPAE